MAISKNRLRGLSAHQLHRQEANAFLLFHRVHLHDVGVVEGGDDLRLPLESRPALGAFGKLGRKDFERDLAVELRVLGEVDLALPALSELLEDAVVRERPAYHPVTSAMATFLPSSNALECISTVIGPQTDGRRRKRSYTV
jgi:hypothetical protein